jgi:BirA family transcriptional regulator, biotin operon repressor / biotin---[acetyl-CoA-carboxylase] ligase
MPKIKINLDEVADLLKESSGYLSGENIALKMGVTRAAVWKAIGLLKKNGYIIESSPSKGYKLIGPPDLCAHDLKNLLAGSSAKIRYELLFFDQVSSTNLIAMDMAAKGCPEGTVVIADSQTAGKGRLGRKWMSPPGMNLYMSIVVKPSILPVHATVLTLLSAVACASAIRNHCGIPVSIKWPNDILAAGLKISGVLTEIRADMDCISYAVIGIGINVNLQDKDIPDEIRKIATSIRIESGRTFSRTELAAAIIREFDSWYGRLLNSGKKDITEKWIELSSTIGRHVKVASGNRIFEGIAEGIDDDGFLIVDMADGSCRKFSAGDVTLGSTGQ